MESATSAPEGSPIEGDASTAPEGAAGPRLGGRPGGAWSGRWPLERALFALAGTMTLASVVLALAVSPLFLILTAFVGVNQFAYVVLGACPASLVLTRLGMRSACRA